MLGEYRRRQSAIQLIPEISALLVLDMQSYFLEKTSHAFVPSGLAILPGVLQLVAAYEESGQPVVFTRHMNTLMDAGMMARWWSELISPDTPPSDIIPELSNHAGIVLIKSQYDAFLGTELDNILRKRGVGQVVITGVMTHLCCETTARSAFMRGFEVFFTVDGTATYTQAFHQATLLNLSHGFAIPVLVDEVLAAFKS